MKLNSQEEARLRLAKSLRQLADHSSEAEIRADLSRSYYSLFHAAEVLLGNITHENIERELGRIDPELGETVGRLKQLRSKADYDPQFVEREFGGDYELFRRKAKDRLDQGRLKFDRILQEIESQKLGSETG